MDGNPGQGLRDSCPGQVSPPPPVPPRSAFPGSSVGFPTSHPMGGSNPWTATMGHSSYYSSPYSNGFNSYSGAGNFNSSTNLIPSGARGPFETVESVVHAVSSISMLLDSTYSALISSVRSVYAVGEQLSRMKAQMGHLYAALAFTRFLRWFRDHFGWVLGRKPTPDLIWTNVADDHNSSKRPSQWPLLLYMGFLIGAPYITWKFVQSVSLSQGEHGQQWMKGGVKPIVVFLEKCFT